MFSATRKRGERPHGRQHRRGAVKATRRQLRGGVIALLGIVVIPMMSAGAAHASAAATLPDGRGYELVSPPGGSREVYSPKTAAGDERDILTTLPFRAAADGSAVTYLGDPGPELHEGNGNTGSGGGNSYIASRTASGWQTQNIMPSTVGGSYSSFSPDLSTGILGYLDLPPVLPPLTAEVAENPDLVDCTVLYRRTISSGELRALYASTTTPNFCGTEEEEPVFVGGNSGTASVPTFSHLLFQTGAALLQGDEEALGEGSDNLYENVNGVTKPVNILGGLPDPNATFGAPGQGTAIDSSNVISSDGSRVVWTDLKTGHIYIREDGTTTIPVSEGAATYWSASPDDSTIYYTEAGALWEFNLDAPSASQHVLLAGEGLGSEPAVVEGVIGVGENADSGAYVYFVATQRLATNETTNGEEAEAGALNLYVENAGATKFIGRLSPEDDEVGRMETHTLGDWKADPGFRTAEVAPDGTHLAFLSINSLTGYDNEEERPGQGPTVVPELFVYDAGSDKLTCASCDPRGNPPSELVKSSEGVPAQPGGAVVPVSANLGFMPRWMASNGERVFFDTAERLVPQDVNHRIQDVYEWEQGGVGSCSAAAEKGCVYLISSGTSSERSYFVDASEDGDDVFLTTRSQLTSAVTGETFSLYDARIGAQESAPSTGCVGSSCETASGSTLPSTVSPTASLSGGGNFLPSTPSTKKTPTTKKKTAAEVQEEQLTRALRQCRNKRGKRERLSCEGQARRRYGAVKKSKRSGARKTKGNR